MDNVIHKNRIYRLLISKIDSKSDYRCLVDHSFMLNEFHREMITK